MKEVESIEHMMMLDSEGKIDLCDIVMRWAKCSMVRIGSFGGIWIQSPMNGRWITNEEANKLVAWYRKREREKQKSANQRQPRPKVAKTIRVSLEQDQVDKLNNYRKSTKLSTSAIIRKAIDYF